MSYSHFLLFGLKGPPQGLNLLGFQFELWLNIWDALSRLFSLGESFIDLFAPFTQSLQTKTQTAAVSKMPMPLETAGPCFHIWQDLIINLSCHKPSANTNRATQYLQARFVSQWVSSLNHTPWSCLYCDSSEISHILHKTSLPTLLSNKPAMPTKLFSALRTRQKWLTILRQKNKEAGTATATWVKS